MFDQSSLEELIIHQLSFETTLISHENTNLKRLTISGNLLQPLAAVLPNITSLTYLRINYPVANSDLLVLIDLVQSHTTLVELEIASKDHSSFDCEVLTNLPKLREAADNCQKVLTIDKAYRYLHDDNDDSDADDDDEESEYNEDDDSSIENNANSDEDND